MDNLLYKRIKNLIAEQIKALPPHSALMSENQFCLKYDASRMTVRRALNELVQEKKVYKIRGKGTFSAPPPPSQPKTGEQLVAAVLPSADTRFMDDIIQGMVTYCRDRNVKFLTLFTRNSYFLERDALQTAARLGCMGIVFMPIDAASPDGIVDFERNHPQIPIIFIDRKHPDFKFGYVGSNHFDIGYTAASYLIKNGRADIALLIPYRKPSSVLERMQGFSRAAKELLGSNEKANYIQYNSMVSFPDQFFDFFEKHPTIDGIVSNSGKPADDIIISLRRLNKKVPDDFSMILIDTESAYLSNYLNCNFQTIIQSGFQIGYTALEELFAVLARSVEPHDTCIPFSLRLV
ncbi:MAG: GntR family transcriptional regulator [Clostridiales bacterium]|nr:GntR family transcriptional regulator [Clostridiales bacterium]